MVTVTHLIAKLQQPQGMYRSSWAKVKKILRAIARYGAVAFPGVRRLSDDTKIPYRTVARLITQAEAVGLLSRAWSGDRKSPTYTLNFVPVVVPVSGETGTERVLRTRPSSTKRDSYSARRRSGRLRRQSTVAGTSVSDMSERKKNRWAGQCNVCSFPVPAGEGFLHGRLPVHEFCDSGTPDLEALRRYQVNKQWQQEQARDQAAPAFGEDPNPPTQTTTVKVDPATRLARHFEDRWIADVLKADPSLRAHRGLHIGAAIGYIRGQFLAKGYSYEHVEAYIDEFMDDLCYEHGSITLSPGQSAWQRFTGWWGSTEVADPKVEQEKQEYIERLKKAMVVRPLEFVDIPKRPRLTG